MTYYLLKVSCGRCEAVKTACYSLVSHTYRRGCLHGGSCRVHFISNLSSSHPARLSSVFHRACGATCSSILGFCYPKCLLCSHDVNAPNRPAYSTNWSAQNYLAFTFMLLELQSCLNLQGEAVDSTLPFRHHDLVYCRLNLEAAKVSSFGHVALQTLHHRYFSTVFDSHLETLHYVIGNHRGRDRITYWSQDSAKFSLSFLYFTMFLSLLVSPLSAIIYCAIFQDWFPDR